MLKQAVEHILYGLLLPVSILALSFIIPEPYSWPIIELGIAPSKFMLFLQNEDLMRKLTVYLFDRMTPNYAPITIVFLFEFWFIVGLFSSVVIHRLIRPKPNSNQGHKMR
jgi:hypothetical protein